MTSAVYDINLDAGSDYDLQLLWKDDQNTPIDLTDFSARMKIKEMYKPANYVDCTSYLNTNGTAGTIDLHIPASITEKITFSVGAYDLEVFNDSGNVYKLLRGKVYIVQEVTK